MEQHKLPSSTLILVFGIISIVSCFCYGIMGYFGIGLLFGINAIVLARNATKIYKENPELYTGFNNVKIGRTLAIIGVILHVLILVCATFGWETMLNPEELQRAIEDMFG